MNDKLRQFYKDNFRNNDQLTLSSESKARVKEKIFANLGAQAVEETPISTFEKIRNIFLKTYIIVPLVIVLFVSGTTIVSAHALPGDVLYPIKRQVEDVQVLLAPTDDAKLDLQVKFAQNRLDEAEALGNKDQSSTLDSNTNNSQVDNTAINPNIHVDLHKENSNSDKDKKDEDTNHSRSANTNTTKTERTSISNSNKFKTLKKSDGVSDQVQIDTDNAIDFLNTVQKKFQNSGHTQRAKDIQDQINKFQKNIQNKLLNHKEKSQDDSENENTNFK